MGSASATMVEPKGDLVAEAWMFIVAVISGAFFGVVLDDFVVGAVMGGAFSAAVPLVRGWR